MEAPKSNPAERPPLAPVLINYAEYNPDCCHKPCARPIKFIRSMLMEDSSFQIATVCEIHHAAEQETLKKFFVPVGQAKEI